MINMPEDNDTGNGEPGDNSKPTPSTKIDQTPESPPKTPKKPADVPETLDLNEKNTAEDLISKANVAAKRQEEANAELSRLLDRQERMKVEETLGGKTEAGEGNKEETPAEYRDRVMKGEV